MSVQAAIAAIAFAPGDIAILNDPYAGGTHLPDITMVLPVFLPGRDQPLFYVSNRAHHADVGGAFPGSMGPANEIFQEGIRIPPVRIVRGGKVDREMLDLILLNVRTSKEREGDLASQMGACRVGEQRVLQLAEKYGEQRLLALIEELFNYSETSLQKTGWITMVSLRFRSRLRCSCDSIRSQPLCTWILLDPLLRLRGV
jgi:N-methylhydantoinase B